jgi:FkbM family methyltransferase
MQRHAVKTSTKAQRLARPLLIPLLRSYVRHAPGTVGKLGLWNKVIAHTWWLETMTVARTFFGARMHVDGGDIVGRYLSYFGIWEPNLTAFIGERLKPGDVFVDVGANVGYFTLFASSLVGDEGGVVAVEVLPSVFEVLERNVRENDARNVRVLNVGAWDKEDQLQVFAEARGLAGTATLLENTEDRWGREAMGIVPVRPLSAILHPDEVAAARFVKIDVEGAEWHALAGLMPFLRSSRDDLEFSIEISPKVLELQNHGPDELLELMRQHRFNAYILDNNYTVANYIHGSVERPVRLTTLPDQETVDLIFSRVDAETI